MKRTIVILVSGLLVGLFSFLGQDNVSLHLAFTQVSTKQKYGQTSPKYQLIGLADAIQFYYKPNVVFLDVRSADSFLKGHIVGAIMDRQGQVLADVSLLRNIGRFKYCILYCDNIGCGEADIRASVLSRLGATNLMVYSGGWEEWQACHLPETIQKDSHL